MENWRWNAGCWSGCSAREERLGSNRTSSHAYAGIAEHDFSERRAVAIQAKRGTGTTGFHGTDLRARLTDAHGRAGGGIARDLGGGRAPHDATQGAHQIKRRRMSEHERGIEVRVRRRRTARSRRRRRKDSGGGSEGSELAPQGAAHPTERRHRKGSKGGSEGSERS